VIDPAEIEARLKAVQALLEEMEADEQPDVDKAAKVADMMQSLSSDLGSAIQQRLADSTQWAPSPDADGPVPSHRSAVSEVRQDEGGRD
jgi:hypothetical protein